MSKTLERRKDRNGECHVTGIAGGVKEQDLARAMVSAAHAIHWCPMSMAENHLIPLRLLPAPVFTLFSHTILQITTETVKRAIMWAFSTYAKSLHPEHKWPSTSLPTVSTHCTPMGQNTRCLKRQFQKGAHALDCSISP